MRGRRAPDRRAGALTPDPLGTCRRCRRQWIFPTATDRSTFNRFMHWIKSPEGRSYFFSESLPVPKAPPALTYADSRHPLLGTGESVPGPQVADDALCAKR